jgi:hypothetical protein
MEMAMKHPRFLAWGVVVFLFLLPGAAMLFTEEVRWTLTDFMFWGLLLAGVGIAGEFVIRKSTDRAYRLAAAITLATKFLMVWLAAAVGILDGADWMLAVILALGTLGSALVRFQAGAMAWILAATAVAQVAAGAAALAAGATRTPPLEVLGLTAFFGVLWLASAWLFRRAARRASSRVAA